KEDVVVRIGLDPTLPTVFYAPTWRGLDTKSASRSDLLFETALELSKLPANIVFRSHYLAGGYDQGVEIPPNLLIPSDSVDTNEILAVTDVLVSDYSSVIFDFAALNRPIFTYTFDESEYESERGLYFSPAEMPGKNVTSRVELMKKLGVALTS